MKKKFFRRIAAATAAAVIGAGSVCAFAACTSDHPEVTITYSFNGESYEVAYVLSREDAPETVQHFIELADAGFYDGTVIHSYDANFVCGGGYVIENGVLKEKDYFNFVKEYEKEHDPFTQTVFKTDKTTPLYTVVGEFSANRRGPASGSPYHKKGALVMYYHDFENRFRYDVYVQRADGGKDNDGEEGDIKEYRYNSATSLFYTFLGESNYERDQKFAVFGEVKNYDEDMAPFISAVTAYSNGLDSDKSFTVSYENFPERLYLYALVQGNDADFDDLRRSAVEATDFTTPLEKPIVVTSVTVDKY